MELLLGLDFDFITESVFGWGLSCTLFVDIDLCRCFNEGIVLCYLLFKSSPVSYRGLNDLD